MPAAKPRPKLKRGMTVRDRQVLREQILQEKINKACWEAKMAGLSMACQQAMQAWGDLAAGLHRKCQGEEAPDGAGCLCQCHDDHRGGVEFGAVDVPEGS